MINIQFYCYDNERLKKDNCESDNVKNDSGEIDDDEFELPRRSIDRARAFPRLELGQGKH